MEMSMILETFHNGYIIGGTMSKDQLILKKLDG